MRTLEELWEEYDVAVIEVHDFKTALTALQKKMTALEQRREEIRQQITEMTHQAPKTRLQQAVKTVEEAGRPVKTPYVANQIGGSVVSVGQQLYLAVRRGLLMQPEEGHFAPLPPNPEPGFQLRPRPYPDSRLQQVTDAVKAAPVTPVRASYILSAIGASSKNGYVLLHRAVRAGLLVKVRRGLYTVPPDT